MNSAGIVKIKVTVQHSRHSGRSASFVVGGQSRFAPCPPHKIRSKKQPTNKFVGCFCLDFMGTEQLQFILSAAS